MKYQWISKNEEVGIVSVYENNLTLNRTCSKNFETAKRVLLGIDSESGEIAIKPISRSEIEKNIYDEDLLYRITVRSSYARISNKKYVGNIMEVFNFQLNGQQSKKFKARWDHHDKLLIVDMKEEV